jgi:hypothetical protein
VEILSGFVVPPKDKRATQKVHPLSSADFIFANEERNWVRRMFGAVGRYIGTGTTREYRLRPAVPPQRYMPHDCWPWLVCECRNGSPPSEIRTRVLDILKRGSQSAMPMSDAGHRGASSMAQSFQSHYGPTNGEPHRSGYPISSRFETYNLRNNPGATVSHEFDPELYGVSTRLQQPHSRLQGEFGIFNPNSARDLAGPSSFGTLGVNITNSDGTALTRPSHSANITDFDSFATEELTSALQASLNEQSTIADIGRTQERLRQALQEYQRNTMSADANEGTRVMDLKEVLSRVLSKAEIYVPDYEGEAAHSEQYVMIVSTIEAVIGDLEFHGITLCPYLFDGQLSILVEDTS